MNAQYEKLGIDIMRGFLRIMREGGKESDAVGNTKVPLTAVTDPEMNWKRSPGDTRRHTPDGQPIVLLVTNTNSDEVGAEKRTHPDPASKRKDGSGSKLVSQPRSSRSNILPQVARAHCPLLRQGVESVDEGDMANRA